MVAWDEEAAYKYVAHESERTYECFLVSEAVQINHRFHSNDQHRDCSLNNAEDTTCQIRELTWYQQEYSLGFGCSVGMGW